MICDEWAPNKTSRAKQTCGLKRHKSIEATNAQANAPGACVSNSAGRLYPRLQHPESFVVFVDFRSWCVTEADWRALEDSGGFNAMIIQKPTLAKKTS